jgi:hypothetical protein
MKPLCTNQLIAIVYMQHCYQLPQHNTWWLFTPFTTNRLDVSSLRVNLSNFCKSSGVCNFSDVEKHLKRNRILVGGYCAAEDAYNKITDMTKYLVCFYTFQLKHLTCIFIGSGVIQFLHWLCSFWMLNTMGRLPLWSSGQSSWLQIQRSRFNSRCYQILWEIVGLERGPLSLMRMNEWMYKGWASLALAPRPTVIYCALPHEDNREAVSRK